MKKRLDRTDYAAGNEQLCVWLARKIVPAHVGIVEVSIFEIGDIWVSLSESVHSVMT